MDNFFWFVACYFFIYPAILIAYIVMMIKMIKQHKAQRQLGKNLWLRYLILTVVVFFVVTWDWLPSEFYYQYKCRTLPPMQVYKTPEEWVKENQDLILADQAIQQERKAQGLPPEKYPYPAPFEEGFKINNESDLPQISKEGYPLTSTFIDKWFVYTSYNMKNTRLLRTSPQKIQVIDRRTGILFMEQSFFRKVVRFYAPPEVGGGKGCASSSEDEKNYARLKKEFKRINGLIEQREILISH